LDIIDIVIGLLLSFWALIMDAPASYRPMNGNDNRVKRKYAWESAITSASTEPKMNLSIGTRRMRHIADMKTDSTVMTRNTCLAARLAPLGLLLPMYWEHRIAPPAASADKACITRILMESTSDTAETADAPTLLTIIVSTVPISEAKRFSSMIGIRSFLISTLEKMWSELLVIEITPLYFTN
jgi:hypothetical protein